MFLAGTENILPVFQQQKVLLLHLLKMIYRFCDLRGAHLSRRVVVERGARGEAPAVREVRLHEDPVRQERRLVRDLGDPYAESGQTLQGSFLAVKFFTIRPSNYRVVHTVDSR